MFQSNSWQEYSDLDVMQMMGRAVCLLSLIQSTHSASRARISRVDLNLV